MGIDFCVMPWVIIDFEVVHAYECSSDVVKDCYALFGFVF